MEGYLARHDALVQGGTKTRVDLGDLAFQVTEALGELLSESGKRSVSVTPPVGCFGMGKKR